MAAEDVVDPSAGSCFFKSYHVFRLFDNADELFVPPFIRADLADFVLGKIVADFASLDFIFYVPDGMERLNGNKLPHVQPTNDPALTWTAHFDGGRVIWPS